MAKKKAKTKRTRSTEWVLGQPLAFAKKKNPTDPNLLARAVVEAAIGEPLTVKLDKGKNPAAVALGRLGGLKGGKARAKKLSAKKRIEIAKRAARARWKD